MTNFYHLELGFGRLGYLAHSLRVGVVCVVIVNLLEGWEWITVRIALTLRQWHLV